MVLQTPERLHLRQTRNTLLVALSLGLFLSLVQIANDFRQEKIHIMQSVNQVLQTAREPAAQAAYGLHEDLALKVVQGLLEYRPIHRAEVYDDFGQVLAAKERPLSLGPFRLLTNSVLGATSAYEISLFVDESSRFVGRIVVRVDNYLVASRFIHRSILIVISAFALSITLSFVLLFQFYRFITRPLLTTVAAVAAMSPDKDRLEPVPVLTGHEHDELGLLAGTINDIVSRFRESETRFRTLVEQAGDAILVIDESGSLLEANRMAARIFGYRPEEFLSLACLDILPHCPLKCIDCEGAEERGEGPVTFETSGRTKGGRLFPVEVRTGLISFSEGEHRLSIIRDISARKEAEEELRRANDELERRVAARTRELLLANEELQKEIQERKRVEKDLMAGEARFRNLFESMKSGVAVFEANGRGEDFLFRDFNRAAERIDRCRREEVLGHRLTEIFPGVASFGLLEVLQRVRRTGIPEQHPATFYRDGRISGWRENYVYPLPSGELVAIYDDVTERKQNEESIRTSLREKELLLREIHHRVKNNMQVITSMLNLQARYVSDSRIAEMFLESRTRIKSMSLIHEMLYRSGDLAQVKMRGYVGRLVEELAAAYPDHAGRLRIEVNVAEITFGIDTAIPCGLVINELVSNAFKHAFPDGGEGMVRVRLSRAGEGYVLEVADNGGGFPEGLDIHRTESLGLRLITTLAEDQLQGSMTVEGGEGTTVRIVFTEIVYARRF